MFYAHVFFKLAVDVDDLLKRAHAELAMELDSELESIYTPGSQDMSIVSKFEIFTSNFLNDGTYSYDTAVIL